MSQLTLISRFTGLLPTSDDLRAFRTNERGNLIAGLTVAVVALPLALAFGVSSGLGAQAGLVTAIVAGSLAAIFGGSNLQVSGPTGAMTVVLIPVVHSHGFDGVLTVGLIAGIILILMGLLRLGQLARFIPEPVLVGFTAGIAVVIALQQVPNALGVKGVGDQAWKVAADSASGFIDHPNWVPLGMTFAVAAMMLVGAKWHPTIPFSLPAVVFATVVSCFAHLDVATIGALPSGLPRPSLAFLHLSEVPGLLPSALAVAALGSLESLLSATVADGMTVGQQHDPDRELFGQGIANLASPLFGGMPATAAIARTAVNVRSGATSKLAALSHAIVLGLIVYTVAPLVGRIPLAALAGVLLATCVRMVDAGAMRALARSTWADAVVMVATFSITVAIDLVTAVAVGIGLAIFFALRSVANHGTMEQVPLDHTDHTFEERALLAEHIVAYRFDGPLFFAAAHRFLLELTESSNVKVAILRMSRVTTLDASGARLLADVITKLENRGIVVMLSGVKPGHDQILSVLGVAKHLRDEGLIFDDTPQAIDRAHDILRGQGILPTPLIRPTQLEAPAVAS